MATTMEKTDRVSEHWTIWQPLGGFKRAMGLISIIILIASGAGYLPLSESLEAMFTSLAGVAMAGNTAVHLATKK